MRFTDQLGDLFDHRRLVHLIGQFGDDDGFAFLANFLDGDATAHHDRSATGFIGRPDAGTAQDNAARREVGAGHDFEQLLGDDLGIVEHQQRRVDGFAQIVGRDIGRHADRNAAAAVDQHIGEPRRQHRRLALGAVIVVAEVDRVLVEIVEQRIGDPLHAYFGVAHRRRHIAIDRAEIALTFHEQLPHGEVLRHAHQGKIHRLIAVGVIFTDHVPDDTGRLAIGLVVFVAVLAHRKQNAAVHGLESVAHVRQRATDDDTHRVIEIRFTHLVGDGDDRNVRWRHSASSVCRRIGHWGDSWLVLVLCL